MCRVCLCMCVCHCTDSVILNEPDSSVVFLIFLQTLSFSLLLSRSCTITSHAFTLPLIFTFALFYSARRHRSSFEITTNNYANHATATCQLFSKRSRKNIQRKTVLQILGNVNVTEQHFHGKGFKAHACFPRLKCVCVCVRI